VMRADEIREPAHADHATGARSWAQA
jgi:hypothetical protein